MEIAFTRLDQLRSHRVVALERGAITQSDTWKRSPRGDELILVPISDWAAWEYNPNLVPFNLKVIGVYPEDFFNHRIAVRSDCGAFWWAIAHLKYRCILATNTLHSLVLRILFRSGMLRVKPYEKPTLKDFHPDFLLLFHWATIVSCVGLLQKTYPNLVRPSLVFSSRFNQGSRLLLVHGRQVPVKPTVLYLQGHSQD